MTALTVAPSPTTSTGVAVEEMLRFRSPVYYMRRTALEDTELEGRRIRKGDKLQVLMWARLDTVHWLVRNLAGSIVFAVIVLFQSDIRRALIVHQ